MTNRQEHPNETPSITSLPIVTSDVLSFYRERIPSLSHLDREVRSADTVLAGFILARAGELAPGIDNIQEKTRVAQLALEVYGLLRYQTQVNNLEAMFQATASPELGIPTSGVDASD